MPYCKFGDKPTVTYKFADSNQKVYESAVSPIDVKLEPFNPQFTGGQCPVDYEAKAYRVFSLGHETQQGIHIVTVYYSGIVKGMIKEIPTKYPGNPTGGFTISATAHGVLSKDSASGIETLRHLGYVEHNPPNIFASSYSWNYGISGAITSVRRIDGQPDDCGDPKKYVRLIVSYENQEIFSDFGEAPGKFSVACEGCPEGTIRCNAPGYPGYCCIPCKKVAARINNLAARI
ncbi:hypothetical protein [Gloeocapsopsis dulcis]|uniref:Uncharacterized protein n=1 Tax=Gloeocapsopsis dulcis AAB1 = 1H9 TaxID=1433147 RepID=A0A6N8G2C6_9CHRO|nr:hypothetical protein [Gloeocapsopsis dulcis]MUL39341.1 hypothetical protein [Gloeocapsopsis dulcis AAB1 = 1H9]WNN89703.1 hypothetical protein P0S91_00980 [Gloeocapsopsis dulcis]